MTDNDAFTIPRVTVLHGHTDPDTAYLVDDYPYGFRLRCQIRYWIETAAKGASKGDQRFMTQTMNPKRPGVVWNKPKASTYSLIKVMYLDDVGHVHAYGVSMHLDGPRDARTRAMGIYDALPERERKLYDAVLAISRKQNPNTWEEWRDKVSALAHHIATTGEPPTLVNNVWTDGDHHVYLSDPAAYVTAAHHILGRK